MHRLVKTGLLVGVMALGGCASRSIVGTWNGRGSEADASFSFGSVSFVGDHTFTAEARYAGTTRVQSGTWKTSGEHLHLKSGGTDRKYTYSLRNGELVVVDPTSGASITLDRMKK